jgi:hypothetical protein
MCHSTMISINQTKRGCMHAWIHFNSDHTIVLLHTCIYTCICLHVMWITQYSLASKIRGIYVFVSILFLEWLAKVTRAVRPVVNVIDVLQVLVRDNIPEDGFSCDASESHLACIAQLTYPPIV